MKKALFPLCIVIIALLLVAPFAHEFFMLEMSDAARLQNSDNITEICRILENSTDMFGVIISAVRILYEVLAFLPNLIIGFFRYVADLIMFWR